MPSSQPSPLTAALPSSKLPPRMPSMSHLEQSLHELAMLRQELQSVRQSGDVKALDALAGRVQSMDRRQESLLENMQALAQLPTEQLAAMRSFSSSASTPSSNPAPTMLEVAQWSTKDAEQNLAALRLMDGEQEKTLDHHLALLQRQQDAEKQGMLNKLAELRAKELELKALQGKLDGLVAQQSALQRKQALAERQISAAPVRPSSAAASTATVRPQSVSLARPPSMPVIPTINSGSKQDKMQSFGNYVDSLSPQECMSLMADLTHRRDALVEIKRTMDTALQQQGLLEEDEHAATGAVVQVEQQITEEVQEEEEEAQETNDDDLEHMLRRLDALSNKQESLRSSRMELVKPNEPEIKVVASHGSIAAPVPSASSKIDTARMEHDVEKLDQLAASVESNITALSSYLSELTAMRGAVEDSRELDELIVSLTAQLQESFAFRTRIHQLKSSLMTLVDSASDAVAMTRNEKPASHFETLVQQVQFADNLSPQEKLERVEAIYEQEMKEELAKVESQSALNAKTAESVRDETTEKAEEDGMSDLGPEQHDVLDQVALFVASNDQNPVYLRSLFQKLREVDQLGLRDQLIGVLDFLILNGHQKQHWASASNADESAPIVSKPAAMATESIAHTHIGGCCDQGIIIKEIPYEEEPVEVKGNEEEEEKQVENDTLPGIELDLANFVTALTDASPEEIFSNELLMRLKTIVMDMVRSVSENMQEPAWALAFERLVDGTLSMYLNESVQENRSLLLRDVNSIIYEIVLPENDEEEAEEKDDDADNNVDAVIPEMTVEEETPATQEDVQTYESSLQWKEVVEDDVRADERQQEEPKTAYYYADIKLPTTAAEAKDMPQPEVVQELFKKLFPEMADLASASSASGGFNATTAIQEIMDSLLAAGGSSTSSNNPSS